MARFRFPYETMLDLRRHAERRKQVEVGELERTRRSIEERIRAIQDAIGRTKGDLRDSLSGAGEAYELRLHAGSVLRMQSQAHQLALQLAGVHARIGRAREELASASRDRRAVELMKERMLERWKQDERRKENAEMDDLVLMRGVGAGRRGDA